MEDAFALFGFERRPLIDEAALKERYLRLAAARHPDTSGGGEEKFHLLQEAYTTLREPSSRLRHLVELRPSNSEKAAGRAPHEDLFLCAAGAVQSARTVVQRLERTTSVLARALLVPEIATALSQSREALISIQQAGEELIKRLEDVDSRWPEVSPSELAALASSFKFLARWKAELSEWEFRLSQLKVGR